MECRSNVRPGGRELEGTTDVPFPEQVVDLPVRRDERIPGVHGARGTAGSQGKEPEHGDEAPASN